MDFPDNSLLSAVEEHVLVVRPALGVGRIKVDDH